MMPGAVSGKSPYIHLCHIHCSYHYYPAYIMSDQPAMKIAAIYTLYFIYYSQPTCWKRFGIRVDPSKFIVRDGLGSLCKLIYGSDVVSIT